MIPADFPTSAEDSFCNRGEVVQMKGLVIYKLSCTYLLLPRVDTDMKATVLI